MARYKIITMTGYSTVVAADTFDLNGTFVTFYNTKTLVPTDQRYDQMSQFRDFVAAFAHDAVTSITKLEGDK